MHRVFARMLVTGAGLAMLAGAAHADGGWLDETPAPVWNAPRMKVPEVAAVPPEEMGNPRCAERVRPPETDEDREVVLAGWYLVGEYHAGWGMKVVTGASSFDGMCRPLGYQQFVFMDGLFTGTVSPVLMDSRTDGAATRATLTDAGRMIVSFARYGAADPLCCPARESLASYRIDRSIGAPVLLLEGVFTQPVAPGP